MNSSTPFFARCSAGLICLAATLLASCSSVKIQSQRSPAAAGPVSLRNLMVVALDERPAMRARFEDQFLKQWKVAGVECTASYGRFTLADFGGDREEIRRKLAAAGVASVLVFRATDRATGVQGPGSSALGVAGALYGGELTMSGVDNARYRQFTSGGEITTHLVVGGKLFRVTDGALLWSCFTETLLKESYDQDAVLRTLAGAGAEQLRRDKIFN